MNRSDFRKVWYKDGDTQPCFEVYHKEELIGFAAGHDAAEKLITDHIEHYSNRANIRF